MRSLCYLIPVAALVFSQPGFAQKLVDPNSVAPGFREAAEKRRAEQVRLVDCRHKADGQGDAAGPGVARHPLPGSCGRQVGFDRHSSVRRPQPGKAKPGMIGKIRKNSLEADGTRGNRRPLSRSDDDYFTALGASPGGWGRLFVQEAWVMLHRCIEYTVTSSTP
jgi:hypothetical protein